MKNRIKSVKVKLFITLSLTILIIIVFLIIVNNSTLEHFYLYTKKNNLKAVYEEINNYYNNPNMEYSIDVDNELEKLSIRNSFDILIKDNTNNILYFSNKNFSTNSSLFKEVEDKIKMNIGEEIESSDSFKIKTQKDIKNGIKYIMLSGILDNGYYVYLRMPVASIQDSVKISNNFLLLIACFTILLAGFIISIISRKFTDPILELNDIAKKMSNLDFSQKYRITDGEDEINDLGKSINLMSDKLERTIKQLRNTNIELEKDIEEKSQIDEMRKSFISDVSHELKTPIALIQGYSEGLLENVNKDEESRKYYAEVILDETNKMDRLVKQLLELMKLEYEKREFDNKKFDIVELEKEVLRKSKVILEEKNINLIFNEKRKILVNADDFYIEQVLTNYLTNAIKNVKEINEEKYIQLENIINTETNKVSIKVFNTGNQIPEENISRIWNRFYKVDESRNRSEGGTGIGLAFVKAIMNNYNNNYGVDNKSNGVEFYFELDQWEQ